MISIEINDILYEGLLSAGIKRAFNELEVVANIVISRDDKLPKFFTNDRIKLYIKNQVVLSGYIDEISVSGDNDGDNIELKIIDKISDFSNSYVGNSVVQLQGDTTLKQMIEFLLFEKNLIDEIEVLDEAGDIEPFTELDNIQADLTDKIFDFISKYAQKRQVMLFNDGAGNIVLSRNGGNRVNTLLKQGYNILSSSSTVSVANLFYKYVVKSQPTSNAGEYNAEQASGEGIEGVYVNKDMASRPSRLIVKELETSTADVNLLNEKARYEHEIRLADSNIYTCRVGGLTFQNLDTGKNEIWRPNIIVNVYDPSRYVIGALFVKEVVMQYSIDGAYTNLTLCPSYLYDVKKNIDEVEQDADLLSMNDKKYRELNQFLV